MKTRFLLGLMSMCVAQTLLADPIDLDKARQLAAPFVNDGEVSLVKRAVRSEAKSRTLTAEVRATSPYYIFSRGENKGFVIVSGDDCLPQILGYTESGDYNEELLPPHFFNWLNSYAALIEEAQAQGVNVSRDRTRAAEAATRSTKVDIAPLLTTHWHQSGPYNNLCPFLEGTTNRSLTGCVATAAAQVVYYYRKDNPSTLQATTSLYDWSNGAPVTEIYEKGTPMKWDLMLDHYNGTRPAEYDDAVAVFTAALGHANKLGYGSSTWGQIGDLVATFSNFFRMKGTCEYKNGMALAPWENKIYNDLVKGHPIVYSGVHPDNGGHAIVLDGYNAKTNLFHFNFGWGGQADGYYTVDDETGVNGFSGQQGMVFGIEPKVRNISADIMRPSAFHVNATNELRVKVTNNATLPFSGVYLFMNTTGSKPTSLTSAKSEDETTVFAADGTDNYITLTCKPTQDKDCYIWITDDKLNILDKDTIKATVAKSNLQLYAVDIKGSSDVQSFDSKDYTVVYNSTKATCEVEIGNSGNVDYEGSPRLAVYGSNDEGKTFEYVGYKSGKLAVKAGERTRFEVTLVNTSTCPIEPGKPYYAVLENPITSIAADDTVKYATSDTIVRFVLAEKTLAVESFENGCVKMSGKWDYNEFLTKAKSTIYKTATLFDLTAVEGIGSMPVCENNPNALFLVANDVAIEGDNMVKADGTAASISLTAGYNYTPTQTIKAERVTFNIAQEPAHWYMLTAPCTLSVPDGIIAREVNTHNRYGISNKTTNVTTLEAGKTYLVMTSSSRNQTLVAENVECVAAVVENVDTAVVGTFTATTTPAGGLLIDHADEYFHPVDSGAAVEAMRGYFYDPEIIEEFRAYSNTSIDSKYLVLGQSIETAYDVLEEYESIVTDKAYEEMLDSIHAAEYVFSAQTITNGLKVTKYAEALLELVENYKQQIETNVASSEVDVTSLIANPSFETGSLTGWTSEDNTIAKVRDAANLFYKGVGSNGDHLLCNMSTDSLGVKISQTLTGLTPGCYRLTAMLGSDLGNTITMFANDLQTTVAAHSFGKYYLSEARIDSIHVGEEGTLEIGVEAGEWYKADDFRLTFLGTGEDNIPDAIESVQTATPTVKVVPVAGGVSITTPSTCHVAVYSVTGAQVWNGTVSGTEFVQLMPGLYIVDKQKVLVR